jgi:hypothetical protein
MRIVVTINGTFPENPDYQHQRLACSWMLNTASNASHGEGLTIYWDNGDGPITWVFNGTVLHEGDIGTATWSVECFNSNITPTVKKYDSGTIEITA